MGFQLRSFCIMTPFSLLVLAQAVKLLTSNAVSSDKKSIFLSTFIV